jgi:hypothetical protein
LYVQNPNLGLLESDEWLTPLTDRWRTQLLSHGLGLGQALVRPHYCLQDVYPLPAQCIRNPLTIC